MLHFWRSAFDLFKRPSRCAAMATVVFACVLLGVPAMASLMGGSDGPEIVSAGLDETNPDILYIELKNAPATAAVSNDGGKTFNRIDLKAIPTHLNRQLSTGTRRYAIADSRHIFRSDDGGTTWTQTGAAAFLAEGCDPAAVIRKQAHIAKYGTWMPTRSPFWTALFMGLSCLCGAGAFFGLRKSSHAWPIPTTMWIAFILFLVYIMLSGSHWMMRWLWDQGNTSSLWAPTHKLGLAMAIAARPLPLVIYFIALWPVLPGSLTIMSGPSDAQAAARRKTAHAITITTGIALLLFHGWLLAGPLMCAA